MTYAHVLMSAALLASTAFAQPALAQASQPVEGSLTSDDQFEADGRRYDDHRLRLDAGARYRIAVGSSDFDTLIRVYGPAGGAPLAEDDDGGGGSNSSLLFSPRESGEYRLRVTSYSGENLGDYTGSVRTLAPLAPPVTRPTSSASLKVDTFAGQLVDDDGEPGVADFQVRVNAGQAIWASAESDDFDTVLLAFRAGELDGEPMARNDDAGGTNSLLRFTPDESGDYILRVTAFRGESGGAFTLQVAR